MQIPRNVQAFIDDGALFVINHSGGKDSQAMTIKLRQIIPARQLIVVHAVLPGVEWDGTEEHARATTAGLPFLTCRSKKTFFDMVEHRQMFPSPQYRQCTSDLKRDPINRLVRQYAADHGFDQIVQCIGIRSEESASRRKQPVVKLDKRMSKAGRTVLVWHPIHDMLVDEVFETIAQAGETPHWAYLAGMTRLSCCFCIMSSKADLTTAAKLNPALYAEYVATERRLGFTLSPSQEYLEDITGIAAMAAAA